MYVPKTIPEHSVIDSAKQNREFHEVYESIKDNRIELARLRNQVDAYLNIVGPDRAGLEDRITRLTSLLEAQISGATFVSLYDATRIVYPTSISDLEKATYEQEYGRATLGILNSTRIYIMTDSLTGNKTIANDVESLVTRSSTTNKGSGVKLDQILENSLSSAFDPDPRKMYFARFVTYDPGLTSIDLDIIARTRGLVDQKVNTVRINPLPEGTLSLMSMRYESSNSESKFFKNSGYGIEYGAAVEAMRKTSWSFDDTLVNKIGLTFKQTYKEGSQPYVFPMGLRQLAFEYNEYTNRSYIGFKVRVPTGRIGFMGLESNLDAYSTVQLKVYPDLDSFNNRNDNFVYQSGDVISYNQPVEVAEGTDIYILAELNKFTNTDATPELEKIAITWR